jgi:hypothetical protein
MRSSWVFNVDDCSELSSLFEIVIGMIRGLHGESCIIMNFNDHTVTWDTDTIPMKDRDTELYHHQRL